MRITLMLFTVTVSAVVIMAAALKPEAAKLPIGKAVVKSISATVADSDQEEVGEPFDSHPQGIDLVLDDTVERGKIDAVSTLKVQELGTFLLDHPGYHVHIIGHSYGQNNPVSNKKLSQQHADAVRELLVEQGLNAMCVTTEGCGDEEPVANAAAKTGYLAFSHLELQLIR